MTRWNIAAGQFFFRYRNTIFPVVFALVIPLGLRPHLMFGNPLVDHLLVSAGIVVALLGEGVRLLTIGFEYIERGGKNKQVWASRLVQGGVYAHTRNPMYLGNMLIATGMCMAAGSVGAYVLLLPFFLFVYQAITAAEEAYLQQKFGSEYTAYCARVPRILPTVRGIRASFGGIPYDWKRAVRKELSTLAGLLIGISLLRLWRIYFLQGFAVARTHLLETIVSIVTVLVLYGWLHYLKKHTQVLYNPSEGHESRPAPRGLMGRLTKRLSKPRFLLAYPLVIWFFLVARTTEHRLVIGIVFATFGLMLRFWANGYVGHSKVNWTQKSRGDAKIGQLITAGPYAYVRHPLYLGGFLLGTGFCIIAGNLWLSLAALMFFLVVYRQKMAQEETLIRDEVGPAYSVYHAAVPRWIPTWRRYPQPHGQWSWYGIQKSREWKTVIWVTVLLIALYLREEAGEHQAFFFGPGGMKRLVVCLILAGLILTDGLLESYRRLHRATVPS